VTAEVDVLHRTLHTAASPPPTSRLGTGARLELEATASPFGIAA
jgi:hypothetical protein